MKSNGLSCNFLGNLDNEIQCILAFVQKYFSRFFHQSEPVSSVNSQSYRQSLPNIGYWLHIPRTDEQKYWIREENLWKNKIILLALISRKYSSRESISLELRSSAKIRHPFRNFQLILDWFFHSKILVIRPFKMIWSNGLLWLKFNCSKDVNVNWHGGHIGCLFDSTPLWHRRQNWKQLKSNKNEIEKSQKCRCCKPKFVVFK